MLAHGGCSSGTSDKGSSGQFSGPAAGEAVFQKLPEESENTADAPSDAGAGEVRVKADLIVAADGVNSQARAILQKLVRACNVTDKN